MSTENTRELPDTVENAAATHGQEMPWKELGLKEDEYARICDILGRRPTNAELAMYSVMWSEHCSYKSSKKHLAEQFGARTTPAMKKHLLVGMGQNAGVVDIGGGWAVTFKVESHNHPSFVEPYQGAATGVGGIVRDIISMGARPIAVMDQLRFGAVDHPDTARVVHGVVCGVGGYGNCLGLPNIGGETEFDPSYGGASILASETFEDGMPAKRPSVQVGDPFMEKVLIECCLDLFEAGVVQGIQDLGAAGISCATSELASNGDSGMHVDLENVLLRDPTLTAGEILMSESQERMMAIVTPQDRERFFEIIDRWDVEAAVIGHLTGDGRLTIDHHGHRIVDVDPKTVAHEGPVYDRPYARPAWQDDLQAATSENLPRPASRDELIADVRAVLADVNQASKAWVTDQYDRYVQGNTALAQPDDAGVIRVDEESGLGVALATDANGWYTKLDPAAGARQALAESYRNVAVVGAEPVAITDCLNFGNPEDTDAMWQLVTAMTALADGCIELEIPVTGGNVSLYNSSGTEKGQPNSSINPTPVIGMLGILSDVTRANPSGFTEEGLAVILLGTTREEFDGSAWARIARSHLGGLPPEVDLSAEVALGNVVRALSAADGPDGRPLVRAAHDLSNGGLVQSLADSALRFGVGGVFDVAPAARRDGVGDHEMLLSESQARAFVAVPEAAVKAVYAAAEAEGVEATRIGTTGGDMLAISGIDLLAAEGEGGGWVVSLDELRELSESGRRHF